jgi:hypothetical protein
MAGEALDPAAYIFEGLWTDWTRGRALGLTWTLCPSRATLLTNSLALFVTLAGGQLWTIIRFSLHQFRAAHRPKVYSERFLQQQVILRNASTDLHTMRLMAQVGWASRNAFGKQFMFPLTIVLLALTHYVVFVAAGTLSNNLINTGSEGTFSTKRLNVSSAALSRSPHCGTWKPEFVNFASGNLDPTSLETVETSLEFIAKSDRSVQLSLEYAQDCYLANTSYYMSSKCDTFKIPKINFDVKKYTGSCPFGFQMCHDEDDVIVLETQTLDSHHHLGLNSPANDRLNYTRRTTCAVLNDTGRVTEVAKSTSLATAYAFYGPSFISNWTYAWSNFTSLYTEFIPTITNPYLLNPQIAYGFSPDIDMTEFNFFEPLPELKQDRSDLLLFFLSFSGRYFEAVDDPWFAAHQLHKTEAQAVFARNQYEKDRPISTLGCLEQHQFCRSSGECTPFSGWAQSQSFGYFNSALSPRQQSAFDKIVSATAKSTLWQVTSTLTRTSTPLLAAQKAASRSTVLSSKLPVGQWRTEVHYWHAVAMAQFQRTIAQWGTGQIAPDPETQLGRPQTAGDIWFCSNMMVPSTVYQSFSVVWLAAIVAIGTVIILISWTIEDISDWLHIRTLRSSALRKIWDSYHMLRLTGFMMRNSWGPLPPPKDFAPVPRIQVWPEPDLPQTVRIVTPSDPGHHSPHPFTTFGTSSTLKQDETWSAKSASMSRYWSELPSPPRRDSWIELGLNHFDFGLEESAPEIKHTDERKLPTPPLPPQAPHLAISGLRAHAIARSQRRQT